MYIKYFNQQNVMKIEKLDLTVSEDVCDDTKEKIFWLTNCNVGRKIDEILNLSACEFIELLDRNHILDQSRHKCTITGYLDKDRYEYSDSYIAICRHEFLTAKQLEKFMKLLESAILEDKKLFDITAITADDIGKE